MSKNGIRSLVIVLALSIIFWSALVTAILHGAGVFNG